MRQSSEIATNPPHSASLSPPPRLENVVFLTHEVLVRVITESPPSVANIKFGPRSSSIPFCYAEGTPLARYQFTLYLNSFAHSTQVLHGSNLLQVFAVRNEPSVLPLRCAHPWLTL